MLRNKTSHRNEKPVHHNEEKPLLTATRESLHAETKTQRSKKKKKKRMILGEPSSVRNFEMGKYVFVLLKFKLQMGGQIRIQKY